jgi:hypothetical protein
VLGSCYGTPAVNTGYLDKAYENGGTALKFDVRPESGQVTGPNVPQGQDKVMVPDKPQLREGPVDPGQTVRNGTSQQPRGMEDYIASPK